MSELVTLPNNYKWSSKPPIQWPGVPQTARFTNHSSSHKSGSTGTDNQIKTNMGENINPGRDGSLYTEAGGFYSNVQTKTSTVFYSQHFIGHLNGNTISSGSSIKTSTKSTWLQDVIGFHCEIGSMPVGSGSEADGCGRVDQWRIAAVYADSNNKCRIMEMTANGVKLSSQTYNSHPGDGWKILSYHLAHNDALKVINNQWLLYGWIIEYQHKKTCGGNNKQKNCTGRTRYMRPLISSVNSLTALNPIKENMLVFHWENTLSTIRGTDGKMLQVI